MEVVKKKSKKTTEDGKISHAHGLAEPILWKWLYYQKQSKCSMQSPPNSNDIHHRDWKINPKVHLETQKTETSQGNTEQKEQQYLTSHYATEPQQ
jgi:hypothetical protein